jgi:NADPH:quinone reductase-like Zn-dependent oxidoreductase
MRAVQFHAYGGPEALVWEETDPPHPGPGEIRIAVRAASVNPIDWKTLGGLMAGGSPLVGTGRPGRDAAGVVDELGPDVQGVSIGDEVFGLGIGTHAEHAVLESWCLKPDGVSWELAAAAGLAAEAAERGLRLLDLQPGQTVFIDGGAGGVGTVAVQMALARGLRVVASAGASNQWYLLGLGAIPVLTGVGLIRRVQAAVGRVDAVFDVVGKSPVEDLVRLVLDPMRVVSIANFAAASTGVRITGGGRDSRPTAALTEATALFADRRLQIPVAVFTMPDAAEAFHASREGHVRGKLVLTGAA